jgi:hypothetical protein
MIDGRPEPRPGRVRFAGTPDIDRLLADARASAPLYWRKVYQPLPSALLRTRG